MIQSISSPQLSSAKPRTGLQSIANLIPRLVRQYEIQAEFCNRQASLGGIAPANQKSSSSTHQATFAWYE
jgi:hypothetical protein